MKSPSYPKREAPVSKNRSGTEACRAQWAKQAGEASGIARGACATMRVPRAPPGDNYDSDTLRQGFSVDSNRTRAALGPRGVGGIRISPLNSPWNPITPLKPPRPHGPGPGAVLLLACSNVGQYVFDAFLILSKRTGISIVAFGSAEILVFLRFALGIRWGFHPQTPAWGHCPQTPSSLRAGFKVWFIRTDTSRPTVRAERP